ncbi:hypothetical protein WA538_005409 [Blastocystis sp. DL]
MGVYDPRNVDTLFIGSRGLSKPQIGDVGLFSQSGALGTALLNELSGATREHWISKFISFGNACDVDEKDCIDYYEKDPTVKQIWTYMEGFHNAPEFIRSVRRVSRSKPVMVLKANRGNSGAKASASHSASLAANDAVCDQLLRNAGAIRCDVWADLHNIGTVLRNQPLPKGRRVAVVTDAGGFGVLLADSVDTYRMNLTDFSPETIKKFKATFPPFYACSNPMDLTGSVKTHEFIEAAKLALADPNVDSVIFAYQPGAPGLELPLEMAKTIEKNFGPGKTTKPFIVLEFGGKYPDDDVIRDYLSKVGMSVYDGPEEGMRVLSKLADYSEYLQRVGALRTETHPKVDAQLINGLVEKVRGKGRYTLTEIEGYDILSACGIRTPDYKLVSKGTEAADFLSKAMTQPGDKFVAKIVSPDIIHKSDVGGVKLGFNTPEEACSIVEELNAKFSKQPIDYHGVMLYKMVPFGTEMMIGANRDPTFGPITVSGLGGVMVEILRDVVFNMCPVSVEEAKMSLDNLKTQKMLNGFRGQPAVNRDKFAEYISTISQIMAQCPSIREIDINPLIQLHDGSLTAVDSVFTLSH